MTPEDGIKALLLLNQKLICTHPGAYTFSQLPIPNIFFSWIQAFLSTGDEASSF